MRAGDGQLSSPPSPPSSPRYLAFRSLVESRPLVFTFVRSAERRMRRRRRRKTERHRKNSHPGYPPRMVQRHCRGHLDVFRGCTRVHQRIHSNFDLSSMVEPRGSLGPSYLNLSRPLSCPLVVVRARSKQQVKFALNARSRFNKADKIQRKNICTPARRMELDRVGKR